MDLAEGANPLIAITTDKPSLHPPTPHTAFRLWQHHARPPRSTHGQAIADSIKHQSALLDGEIVCLDASGRSQFNDLLFRRGEPYFFAFDLLWHEREHLCNLPLIERKLRLCSLRPKQRSRLLYCVHVEEHGEDLFRLACEHDLEGIVAKHKFSPYVSGEGETSWIKIRNANSQIAGRDELFNRDSKRRHEQASDGWSGCVLVCVEQEM